MPRTKAPSNTYYITFDPGHDDLIHDMAYDFYGKRIVTCSSDQRLKIFERNNDEEWVLTESWKAHEGSISKVLWGHPEHGNIIASCANDRTVRIWEEQELEPKSSSRRWKRHPPIFADSAIFDISFAPVHRGLKLACISSTGTLQILEAPEPQDPSVWTCIQQLSILDTPPAREIETSFVVEYCPSRWGSEQLAVAAMNTVHIYRQEANSSKYQAMEELEGHRGLVRAISWAPTMGRSYHLIATACKDGYVRIFKLTDIRASFAQPKATQSQTQSQPFLHPHQQPSQKRLTPTPTTTLNQSQPRTSGLIGKGLAASATGQSASHLPPINTFTASSTSQSHHDRSLSGADELLPLGPPTFSSTSTSLTEVDDYNDLEDSPDYDAGFDAEGAPGPHFKPLKGQLFEHISSGSGSGGTGSNTPVPHPAATSATQDTSYSSLNDTYHVDLIAKFDDHRSDVWRVKWNTTGTILSSAGDDGKIRLWKAVMSGEFKCFSVVEGRIGRGGHSGGASRDEED